MGESCAAYSDEILHRARLSPIKWTGRLAPEDIERLYAAVKETLTDWSARLRQDAGDAFPEKVTAFRKGMAVHGRYKEPCPVCGSPVQRIAYASRRACAVTIPAVSRFWTPASRRSAQRSPHPTTP